MLKSDFALLNNCLLKKDKAVGFYRRFFSFILVMIPKVYKLVATRVVLILPPFWSTGTKSNSRIAGETVVFIISQNPNSCNRSIGFSIRRLYIKPFHIALPLKWWISQERFPLASANIRFMVSVGWHKRVQGARVIRNCYPVGFSSCSLHPNTKFCERCTPETGHFRFILVEARFTRGFVKWHFVSPQVGVVGECSLEKGMTIKLRRRFRIVSLPL